jgi:hypothetical protein
LFARPIRPPIDRQRQAAPAFADWQQETVIGSRAVEIVQRYNQKKKIVFSRRNASSYPGAFARMSSARPAASGGRIISVRGKKEIKPVQFERSC